MAAWRASARPAPSSSSGVTDVLVLERDTVGSGGSGKSSGIVRCHYGIPSLAAMAWRALPVLEDASRGPGRAVGLHAGRATWSGSGRRTSARSGPTSPCTSASASRSSWSATTTARDAVARGPARRLRRVRLRARGGYGDGHQTAHGLRRRGAPRRGPTCASTAAWPRSTWRPAASRGVVLATAAASAPPTSSWRPGPGPPPWPPASASTCPCGPSGPRSSSSTRAGRSGRVPVFSDLVSLQYVRTEGTRPILLGDSDHSDPEWSDPDALPRAGERRRAGHRDPQVRPPLPRPRRRLARLVLRRLLRRHARLQPRDLGRHPSKGCGCAPASRATATRSRPSVGELMADLIVDRRQPPPRHRPPGLPLGALRRGGAPGQPAPLRGGGPDALTRHGPTCS